MMTVIANVVLYMMIVGLQAEHADSDASNVAHAPGQHALCGSNWIEVLLVWKRWISGFGPARLVATRTAVRIGARCSGSWT